MNTSDKPKPSYGYYIVDIKKDGVAPQPGDQYWHIIDKRWEDRAYSGLPLRENDVYQRRVPEIPGYRLLELDDEIVPGTIFFMDGDRAEDFADPDLHTKTKNRSKVVRHAVEQFNCYIAFYAPMTVIEKEAEESTKVNSGWLPVAQFDDGEHLPCWVFDGKEVHLALLSYEGRPYSVAGSHEYDKSISFFYPITPPAERPNPSRDAFEAWWSEKGTEVKASKAFAEAVWNAALATAKEARE